jgi:hypothetical protein
MARVIIVEDETQVGYEILDARTVYATQRRRVENAGVKSKRSPYLQASAK